MIRPFVFFIVVFIVMTETCSQGVGIGTDNPHPDAVMEIKSSNKGLVIPRLTSGNIETLKSSAAEGLIVYDKDVNKYKYFVDGQWQTLNPIPPGTIIMWHGTIPPVGWKICNGQKGTPDLRSQFIVGWHPSIDDYNAVGNNGGKDRYSLKTSEIPSHSHVVNDPGHSHSGGVNSSNHNHGFDFEDISTSINATDDGDGFYKIAGGTNSTSGGDVNQGFYNVTLNSSDAGLNVQNSGNNQSHENRPPFYVLAFIMKE